MSEQGHKKNTNGSLATLPNEVGRVTSDQKVGRVTSDHLTANEHHPFGTPWAMSVNQAGLRHGQADAVFLQHVHALDRPGGDWNGVAP